ncbi:hypothetical protein [Arthrobacter sp. efr-133-TYG-118]|uniref:hypothetical protein n=1 Tax=Arthrobacter sp. efr-133-TYG-118 TaxID=3040279 RepID=UPI00254F0C46|nr:hypothetical protein [Arthrobacter sp. efr-133-TYG-118]
MQQHAISLNRTQFKASETIPTASVDKTANQAEDASEKALAPRAFSERLTLTAWSSPILARV